MDKYICTVCGYIFEEADGILFSELPLNWVCPLCGADKEAFELIGASKDKVEESSMVINEEDRPLQKAEMAALCSNLAKGCDKQHLADESNAFLELEQYFMGKNNVEEHGDISEMIEALSTEIDKTFVEANGVIDLASDRGSKRALVWSEKVSRMLKMIQTTYQKEGDSYIAEKQVYVCEICGFVYIGDDLPKVCPVCKVPNFKMKEIRRDV